MEGETGGGGGGGGVSWGNETEEKVCEKRKVFKAELKELTEVAWWTEMLIIAMVTFQMWEGETGRLKYQYNNSAAGVTAICFVSNRYGRKSASHWSSGAPSGQASIGRVVAVVFLAPTRGGSFSPLVCDTPIKMSFSIGLVHHKCPLVLVWCIINVLCPDSLLRPIFSERNCAINSHKFQPINSRQIVMDRIVTLMICVYRLI